MALVSERQPQPSDEELLFAASNEADAFGLFYDRHFDALLAFFYKRTSDPHTSADLTAETFAAALKGLSKYNTKKGPPSAWLFGIARNHLRHHLRTRGIHRRAIARLMSIDLTVDEVAMERVETGVDIAAQMPLLMTGLDQLSPLLRRAVVLRVVDNLSFDDLALALGCSPGTARQRVSRGLTQLHDFLSSED